MVVKSVRRACCRASAAALSDSVSDVIQYRKAQARFQIRFGVYNIIETCLAGQTINRPRLSKLTFKIPFFDRGLDAMIRQQVFQGRDDSIH